MGVIPIKFIEDIFFKLVTFKVSVFIRLNIVKPAKK